MKWQKRLLSLLLVLVGVFFAFGCEGTTGTEENYSTEELYALAEKSVGEITTYNKQGQALSLGTAFVYSKDGKWITNYHVIEKAYSMKIVLGKTTYTVQKVLAYDKDIDLAVLSVSGTGLTPLSIVKTGVQGGESVYAVGSSEGYTLSFSAGIVASPDRVFDGVHYIQHDAAISHGNSGGPLLNEYGQVVGINTMTNIEGQNLNFAITCSELDNLVYGAALTVAELYAKEFDAFTLVKDYITEKGTYNATDKEYKLYLGRSYSNDYTSTYYRYAYYDTVDKEIQFTLMIDSDYFVSVDIDTIDGIYDWGYIDDDGYYMLGTLYANIFTSNSTLSYYSQNVPYYLRTTTQKLASAMVGLLFVYLESDLSAVGVTAQDFGFNNL